MDNLRKQKVKHEGIRYVCGQCEYQTTRPMQFMHDKTALANRRLRKEEHNLPQRALRADHLRPAIPGSSLPSGPSWWIQPRRSDGPSSVNSKDINQSDDTQDNVDSQVTETEAS